MNRYKENEEDRSKGKIKDKIQDTKEKIIGKLGKKDHGRN
jgi:hypothetical protein